MGTLNLLIRTLGTYISNAESTVPVSLWYGRKFRLHWGGGGGREEEGRKGGRGTDECVYEPVD